MTKESSEKPKNDEKSLKNNSDTFEFKGKYIKTIGRRKTSVAQVRLYEKGKGNVAVNEVRLNKFFNSNLAPVVTQPLKLTGHLSDVDISILVKGGGERGQAEASRHGVARALIMLDKELRSSIKAMGWLTRDSRKKERKKPGLKKARRAPQWSKR